MEFPVHIPFLKLLGARLVRFENGEAEFLLELRHDLHNSFGVAHGGVIMTVMDAAMAHAARSVNRDLPDGGPGAATIEMKTSFMRPGEGELRTLGRLLHRTSTMAFCEARVFNSQDDLLAHATGTFKYARALPGDKRSLKPLQRKLDGDGSD
jgi:uncharacterized protein (TIGR00369 family)